MNLVALVTMILLAREVYAAIPLGIPLTGKQLNQIEMNIALIQIIKQNYFKDRKFYSSLPPIVQLNKNQEEQILAQYGHLFSETKPDILSSYVFNGTEYTENTADIASTGMAVCPSSIGYSDITFTVNAENEVLQMVQMEDSQQWVLEETCESPAGNVPKTICVSRERLINAVVLNMETNETTYEKIKVFCCSAQLTE